MALIQKKLKNGDIAQIREDGTILLIKTDGTVTDEAGKKIDLPGAPGVEGRVFRKTPPEFAAEDVLPVVGAVSGGFAGGLATLPGGVGVPFGATIGAGIGGQFGETGRQYVRALRGKTVPTTPLEAIKETGKQGLIASGLELGGAGLLKGLKLPFMNVGTNLAIKRSPSVIGKKIGLAPITDRRAGQGIQESFEKVFGRQELGFEAEKEAALRTERSIFESEKEARRLRGIKATEEIAKRYGGRELGKQETGEKVAGFFQRELSGKKKTAGKLFEKIRKKSGLAAAPEFNELSSAKYIDNVLRQNEIELGMSGLPANVSQQIEKQLGTKAMLSLERGELAQRGMVEGMEGTSDVVGQQTIRAFTPMTDLLKRLSNPTLSVNDLALMRTEIGRMAYGGTPNQIKKVYRGLYHSLTDDLIVGSEKAGFKDLSQNARALWKNIREAEEGTISKIIEKGEPELMLDSVVKANSPTRIEELFSGIPEEGRNVFRRSFFDSIREKADGDVGIIYKQLAAKTEETKRALFGKDFDAVKQYERVLKAIDRKQNFRSGLEFPEIYTPIEKSTAQSIRSQTPGDIVQTLVGSGKDPTRIRVAFNGMDEFGRQSFRGGFLQKVKDDSKYLINVSDETLDVIYGRDASIFKELRNLVKVKETNLKTGFIDDVVNMAIFYWPPRVIKGASGLLGKIGSMKSLESSRNLFFPKLQSIGKRGVSIGAQGLQLPALANE